MKTEVCPLPLNSHVETVSPNDGKRLSHENWALMNVISETMKIEQLSIPKYWSRKSFTENKNKSPGDEFFKTF